MTTEERIKKSFLTPEHFEAVSKMVLQTTNPNQKKLNIIISFREAGEHTLAMLKAGAGAKPHSILAKSIKEGTLSEKDKAADGMDKLYGLVPTRDEQGVNGLYLTSRGKAKFLEEENPVYELAEENGHPVLRAKADINQFIQTVTRIEDFAKYFITGDYDVHDLISLTSQRHPVVSGSPEETEFMIRLNDAMRGKDVWSTVKGSIKDIHDWKPDEYDLIQHGPQYNYIAYTYNNEKNEKIVEKVARIDTPVAVCSPSGWEIKDTPEELVQYYKDHSIKVKELWQLSEEGEAYIRQRSGKSFNEFMREITGRE